MGIYDYKVKNSEGEIISLSYLKGKVALIVNTATGCGFTPQYEGLEALYQKYHENGLEILDFPCNQFGNQAPGSNKEIANFCALTYHTSFITFGKIDVNGPNEDPLYTYLKDRKAGFIKKSIKWNFTKFLVDKNGKVVKRYSPMVKPESIEKDVKKWLTC